MTSKSIYPYVYKIVDKQTGEFYIGSRHKNVTLGLTPEEDFLIHYFTSSKTVEPRLRENPVGFECSIIFRSGEPEAAYWYEQLLIRENIKDSKCLNGHYIDPDNGSKTFSWTGKSHSPEAKMKMSSMMTGNVNRLGSLHSSESKLKISNSLNGRSASAETKKKMSDARKGKPQPTYICPRCGKTGKGNAMKHYHFDNCKSKLCVGSQQLFHSMGRQVVEDLALATIYLIVQIG